MRLIEIFRMDEEKLMATLRNGQSSPVYKNPTQDELNKVALNGIVRGILTQSNFIAFNFQNIDMRDLPPLHGYPVVLYFGKNDEVTIELGPYIPLSQQNFERWVRGNNYLKPFKINKILVPSNETE